MSHHHRFLHDKFIPMTVANADEIVEFYRQISGKVIHTPICKRACQSITDRRCVTENALAYHLQERNLSGAFLLQKLPIVPT